MAATNQNEGPLVSTQWLAERLADPKIVVVDGSWYLPAMGRDGKAEYQDMHIPGAVFFDIDAISDPGSELPHTLPSASHFGDAVGKLGISENHQIIVYDGGGLFSAPRVWWMFRIFGAPNVSVLDGGLPKWNAENLPLESGSVSRDPVKFNAMLDINAVAYTGDVENALQSGAVQVADARSRPRFQGTAPEPREGIPPGHMPGARNLPATDLVADGRLKPPGDIQSAILQAGLDPARPLITSCGSGVSAAIINLAFERAGYRNPKLYDGSWTEWATRGLPVEPDPHG